MGCCPIACFSRYNHLMPSFLRLLSFILAFTLLAACAGPAAAPSGASAALTPSPSATRIRLMRSSPEPSAAPDMGSPIPTPLPHLEEPLVWLLRADAQRDLALVNEEFNQRLVERGFNARVELRFSDATHYAADLNAAGAPPDLLTTGGQVYESDVAAGLYQPITPQAAPGLWAAIPASVWDTLRRGGTVYAVPSEGLWSRPYGVAVRADVLAALALESQFEGLVAFNDLTSLLATIQAAIADGRLEDALSDRNSPRSALGPVDLVRPEAAGYEPLAAYRVVPAGDDRAAVVNWLQSPALLDLAVLRRSWHTAGFEPPRLPDPQGWLDLCHAGRFAVVVGRLAQPQRCGFTWLEKSLAPLFLSTATIGETLTAVGSTNPERTRRALLLLETVRSDPQLYNLLALGLQGRHWQWDPAGQVIQRLPDSGYQPVIAAQLGRPNLVYPASLAEAQAWQQVSAWNTQSGPAPVPGFHFDPRPVAGPLAAMHGLERELTGALFAGQVQDVQDAIRKLDEQMEALGAGLVAAEVVKQLAQWRALH